MILKYLGIFSFIAAFPAMSAERDTLPWQALDDAELQRLAMRLGDRFDPEEIFGAPAMSRSDRVKVRVYPRGTSDLLVIETLPGKKESPQLERFHAARLRRAFEVRAAGHEAGAILTVWEIRTRAETASPTGLWRWLAK